MESQKPESGILSRLIGPVNVNTKVGINQRDIISTGTVVFVVACLIFAAWYAFKKLV